MVARPTGKSLRERAQAAFDIKMIEQTNEDIRAAYTKGGKTPQEQKLRADLADIRAYLDARTSRDNDGAIDAATFYEHYRADKLCRGGEPVSIQRFGTLMAKHLGVAKVKKNRWYYLGLRFRDAEEMRSKIKAVA